MAEIETPEHQSDSDEIEMSPERFADINIQVLEILLSKEDVEKARSSM
jgi:hypothetical protein